MTVTMVGVSTPTQPCRLPRVSERTILTDDGPVCRKGDVDCLKLQPAPKFNLLHPIPWLEHKAASVAEPMKIDGKILVNGIVGAPFVGAGIKVASIAQEGVRIARTTGLRTFVAQAGWRGTFKTVATAFGKASLRAYAAQGLVVLGAAGAGAIAWRVKHNRDQRAANAAANCR